jgi:hypothetical protein
MLSDLIIQRQRWLRDLPARVALKLFNQPRMRVILGQRYHASLKAHKPALPQPLGIDAQIITALENEGVYVTTLETLGLGKVEPAVAEANALANDFADEARKRVASGEDFVIVPPEQLLDHPSIYLLGLEDRLLDIAERYIGLPPAYDGVTINYTVADGREISTRKWHRDWEDRRMLKIAIYLHDVDETGGPFEMIRRYDTSQGDEGGFNYELADDAALTERLGTTYYEDIVSCVGPAGTVIFTDTARFFHRGKPATSRDRRAIFYSYFAQRPRHPFLCERTGMRRSDIVKLAIALPKRQHSAVFWRKALPLPLRLIPPASL